ncbi:YdeI/OmpD-associated family protein [Aeromicrobium massiliense]|uniref:YdeI/OmpD-associated family protein n=1 Tax=Aeromicrobium massiliense TaxID=1464554 RepID=UPI000675C436|nr:YdeI/OmpD-associated family protein [Aeromicrobium massiliense]
MSIGTPGGTDERPCVFFRDAAEFRAWLEANHGTATELWMGLRKKHVPDRGLTWEDAVPEALCFGWIDSVAQRIDDDVRRQRWTPRKSASTWSAVNVAHVERLVAEGRMTPAGLAAFERRSADRTGVYSHENDDELPAEMLARLQADPVASAWWHGATATYRKVCAHWVVSAKREATRESRFETLLDDSRHGRLVPFQRYGEEPRWCARLREQLGLPG